MRYFTEKPMPIYSAGLSMYIGAKTLRKKICPKHWVQQKSLSLLNILRPTLSDFCTTLYNRSPYVVRVFQK